MNDSQDTIEKSIGSCCNTPILQGLHSVKGLSLVGFFLTVIWDSSFHLVAWPSSRSPHAL